MDTWGHASPYAGQRYEGEYLAGKKNGYGVFTWPDGARYEGQWLAGFPNGYGVGMWPDGGVYEGNWTNGCFKEGNQKAWAIKTKEECGF